jgi:hypothetical protein
VLVEPLVFRADVTVPESTEFAPPAGFSGTDQMVTAVHKELGDAITAGESILEVADRPIIALEGSVPMYRDIKRGVSGVDVRQLQAALAGLGYNVSETGVFDTKTEVAARALYKSVGSDLAAEPYGVSSLYIPKGEIVFVESLPTFVLDLPKTGAIWTGGDGEPSLVVTGSTLQLSGMVSVEYQELLTVGSRGEAFVEGTGEVFPVSVSGVDTDPIFDQAGARIRVEMEPEEPIDLSLNGVNLRVTILAEGAGSQVLAVPLSAVYADAGGDTRVLLASGESVPVVLGATAGGWVEIVSGEIAAGERVVVGLEP